MKNQFHPKYQRKYFWNSALKFFVASWGLPGDLVSDIIIKEGYWKPKKLPGSPQKATKNFRALIQNYFRWYSTKHLHIKKDLPKISLISF